MHSNKICLTPVSVMKRFIHFPFFNAWSAAWKGSNGVLLQVKYLRIKYQKYQMPLSCSALFFFLLHFDNFFFFFQIPRWLFIERQGFQSGPVSGTFTRLRSCIVLAEITEPPKLAVVKTTSTMVDRLVEYFSSKINVHVNCWILAFKSNNCVTTKLMGYSLF